MQVLATPSTRAKMRRSALPDVFVADDKFADVVQCLEARGWRRHAHLSFPKFRLKWVNYSKIAWADDAIKRVQPAQLVNHFQHAVRFSQKDVFARALCAHELASDPSAGVSIDAFFPRTFDLRSAADVQALREWHLYSRALAVLKSYAAQPAAHASGDASAELSAACALLRAVIDAGPAFFSRTVRAQQSGPSVIDTDAPAWRELHQRPRHAVGPSSAQSGSRERVDEVARILAQLEALDAQFDAVGATSASVWICKPANLSQGRGICLLTSLDDILALQAGDSSDRADAAASKWIVQKYVEQPLLSLQRGRKFDIRQWVLIASLAPLRVFWYRTCYLRFCSEAFGRAALDDAFAHLSNHSVQKHAPASADASAFESMWSSDAFQRELWTEHGRDVWSETIVPQMQRATRVAILSTAPELRTVGRGFEWLGLDFVLDAHLRPWLLEVNVSPDVSHSTRVTAELVPRATADLLELLLDDIVRADNGWRPLDCSALPLTDQPPPQEQQQQR